MLEKVTQVNDSELALARHNMIEQQIRPWDVLDERVLKLLDDVPRDQFVPSAYHRLAYADTNIPLGHDQVRAAVAQCERLDVDVGDDLAVPNADPVM